MSEGTEKEVGIVTNFFDRISVAGIDLTGPVKVGDTLHFKSASTDFTQAIESMQIERQNITEAKAGDAIGIRVKEKVKKGDKVFVTS